MFVLRDLPAEEISDSREFASSLRGAFRPRVRSFRKRNGGGCPFLDKQAKPRVVGCGDLFFAVLERGRVCPGKAGEGKFHVRLARSQPHVADQNILSLDGRDSRVAADGERVGSSGWFGI